MISVDEANVIGSAVRKDEIPSPYNKLPLLGKGATTLAFAKDSQTALLFTRDRIKAEWLAHGLGMVHNQQVVHPVHWHHIPHMHQHELIMIEMPMLYALNSANRAIVIRETRQFSKIMSQHRLFSRSQDFRQKLAEVIEIYRQQHPHSHILPLLEWVANYDPRDFFLDIGPRQYKQTANGDIVLLDPVVASDILTLLMRKGHPPRGW